MFIFTLCLKWMSMFSSCLSFCFARLLRSSCIFILFLFTPQTDRRHSAPNLLRMVPDISFRARSSSNRCDCFCERNKQLMLSKGSSSRVSIWDTRGCRIWRQLRTCQHVLHIRSRRNTSTSQGCLDVLPYHSFCNPNHTLSLLLPIEATRDRSFQQLDVRTVLGSSCILLQNCTFLSHPIDNSPTPIPTAISKTIHES